jgi:hypothetical protein
VEGGVTGARRRGGRRCRGGGGRNRSCSWIWVLVFLTCGLRYGGGVRWRQAWESKLGRHSRAPKFFYQLFLYSILRDNYFNALSLNYIFLEC